MIRDITIGQYYPGDTVIHRMDPRLKLVVLLGFIILVFFISSFIGYAAAYAFVIGTAFLSKVPFKFLLRGLKPLVFVLIFTFLINIFFTPGSNVIWQGSGWWSFLRLTWEGVRQAVMMGLRLMLFILISSLLTLTTTPIALTDGMERLLSPLRVFRFPAHELAMMMTIALRFIPTLLEETDKIMKAQMARGADFDSGNLWRRAKALIPLLVPLFVSAFRRADELAMAMEARCYRGGDGRTRMKELHFSRVDAWGVIVFMMLIGFILWDTCFGWAGLF